MDQCNHQFVTDADGKITAVLIPYAEFQKWLTLIEAEEKFDVRTQLIESLQELKLARAGKLTLIDAKDALAEL